MDWSTEFFILTILILCRLFFSVSLAFLSTHTQQARIAADLIELRNKSVFAFLMFNALFVLIVFLLQLNKDQLHVVWPLGVKTNITYVEETSEVSDDQASGERIKSVPWWCSVHGVSLKPPSIRPDDHFWRFPLLRLNFANKTYQNYQILKRLIKLSSLLYNNIIIFRIIIANIITNK